MDMDMDIDIDIDKYKSYMHIKSNLHWMKQLDIHFYFSLSSHLINFMQNQMLVIAGFEGPLYVMSAKTYGNGCNGVLKNIIDCMMTSSNRNIFRVTGHMCGDFVGPRWIPRTEASVAELWYFLWSALE